MATIQDALAVAWKLFQAGDLAGARRVYEKVIELQPTAVAGWLMIGAIHQLEGRIDDAVATYRQALRLDPANVEALNNIGVALHALGNIDEATACLRSAVSLKANYADAHNNLGNALKEQGLLDEAVSCYHRALEVNSAYLGALNNLGNALRLQGKLTDSVAAFEQALALQTDNPQVRMSRALCWLQLGDFDRGWAEYEWRLKCKEFAIPVFREPIWDGSPLDERSILLYADHGMGDSIQFIRYAPLVKARGGRLIVACRQPLARILATCQGVDQVVEEGQVIPDFDVYAPLMSLPRIFGTSVATIPADVPYLHVEAALMEEWRQALEPRAQCNVGIAWQGNPDYRGDRHRSFRLAQLESLARVKGVRLFSLQKGRGVEQIEELEGRFAVTNLGSRVADFMDTAAIMRNLDLVISADSALAHLAGSLAVPTWVAIPIAADWRWLNEREDSPWYPTMRLFRQTKWGDWDLVFERMAAELAAMVNDG